MKVRFEETHCSLVAAALRVAAETYDRDAVAMDATLQTRPAAQFRVQAIQARRLAEAFETAKSFTMERGGGE
jgi:hypothetical protein